MRGKAAAVLEDDVLVVTHRGERERIAITSIKDTWFTFRDTMGGVMFLQLHDGRTVRIGWDDWSGEEARSFKARLEEHPGYNPDGSFERRRRRVLWGFVLVFVLWVAMLLLAKYT